MLDIIEVLIIEGLLYNTSMPIPEWTIAGHTLVYFLLGPAPTIYKCIPSTGGGDGGGDV